MKNRLWTRNFTLLIAASGLGAVGGIAGGFAMSFLVFDETGSTLASALVLATELIPGFLLPLFIAPWMDRMPRKPFLVGGDMLNGVMYLLLGAYLLRGTFSYVGYLAFSLVLASLRAFDELAYNSIFPMLLPEGAEQKGYAVASTLYPVLRVMMLPLSAVLLDAVGAAWLLVGQGVLSLMAAAVESGIRIHEERRPPEENSSLRAWWADVKEAARYLRQEKGLMNIYGYMAVTNGVGSGYSPILVAFFRTFPGMTAAMYSLFSVAEFLGRTVGGFVQYRMEIPEKKRYGFAFLVYMVYEAMDMLLLWLPYPLMLASRGLCGFLGTNSATMRQAAVQRYIPERLRARSTPLNPCCIPARPPCCPWSSGRWGRCWTTACASPCAAGSLWSCAWPPSGGAAAMSGPYMSRAVHKKEGTCVVPSFLCTNVRPVPRAEISHHQKSYFMRFLLNTRAFPGPVRPSRRESPAPRAGPHCPGCSRERPGAVPGSAQPAAARTGPAPPPRTNAFSFS